MRSITNQITDAIESILDKKKKIVIYPCGDIGINAIRLLNDIYGVEPDLIIDNHKCKYNNKILPISILSDMDLSEYVSLLASTNQNIYDELKGQLRRYFRDEDSIVELESMRRKVGKYSYGPLLNCSLVERIGAFCSFAPGVIAVGNHSMNTISTHPFMYHDKSFYPSFKYYDDYKDMDWYFPGVHPHAVKTDRQKMVIIENDVWLGQNVIILNGVHIGNGVIAAAGSVINQDIPDYAIVAGVPAKIIKYRYTSSQIKKLIRIAWWNWSDEEIRNRYEDFYLPVDEFIRKYDEG